MPDDWLRAGGSMWLDALLYDSGRGETESLIADDNVAEAERNATARAERQVL